MIFFYTLVVVSIIAVIGVQLYWITMVNRERKLLEEQETENVTMFDVRELLMEGEKDLAIKVYQDLFNVTKDQAEREVNELGRSIS